MRFDKNKAFPYPVLRPYCDDYKDADFQATVDFAVGSNEISAMFTFVLSSQELMREVERGNAAFFSVVSCRDTYYQSVIQATSTHAEKTFDARNLRGEIRTEHYVVALKDIKDFWAADINPEFGKERFSFRAGDILAQDEPQVFYVDRDLFKPITTVFELVKNEALSKGEWRVSLDEENVQIEVSSDMKSAIDNARNSKANQVVLLNSLYFSAVTEVLRQLQEEAADHDHKRWAKVFLNQLHNAGWDLDENPPYILAQRLMKHPLTILSSYCFAGGDE